MKCTTFHSDLQGDINKDEIGVTVNDVNARDKIYKGFNHLLEVANKII